MMSEKRWGMIVGLALPLGCGSSEDGRGQGQDDGLTTADATGTDSATVDGDGASDGKTKLDLPDGEVPEVVELRIEPADVVIDVVDGVIPNPTDFTAIGTTQDGEEIEVDVGMWSFDRADLATVNQGTGELTPTGLVGGSGQVTFASSGLEATANASVRLVYEWNPSNVDPTIFDNPVGPDPAMALVYPYDQTVFPLGLAGPVLQWNGTNAGEFFRVQIESPYFSYTGYALVDPPARYALPTAPDVPDDLWLKLTESTAPGRVQVSITRRDATQAYQPVQQQWRIADANLTGIIYYWEVNRGTVVRLQVGAEAPEQFLTPPPGWDVGDGNPNNQCIACHSVSSDGSTIVASTYGSASPWGTWNAVDGSNIFLSGNDFAGAYYPADASGFQAVSPDGTYILSGQAQGPDYNANAAAAPGILKLSANNSTVSLASLSVPGGTPVHPVWSHDGTKIAFGVRTNGNWIDFTSSSLWIADVDLVTPGFGIMQQLVAPSPPDRTTVTFPTFSPDSEWIAFNKANQARTREGAGELWMTATDGSIQLQLGRANGVGAIDAAAQAMNFEPTFMPVSVGGYNWLVFVSERMYGNTLVDQAPASRRKQLWVSAIDAVPGGGDPSHPAFWLPGQELDNQNMRGNWALAPCKDLGQSCEAGFECCTGYCGEDGTCTEDVPTCSLDGDACSVAADCCTPDAECINGYCGEIVPG